MSKVKSRTYGNSKRKAGQFLSRKDDAIHWFQREGFDPAEFIGLLKSEKELDQARNELTQLNEYCKQEVQTVVHAHHKDFLEASRDIQDVEVLVDELRNYVSGSVAVVANLVDLPALPKQVASAPPVGVDTSGPHGAVQPPSTWESILALQAELMQELQVAVAERDVSLARALLAAGKHVIAVVDRDGAAVLAAQTNGDGLPAWRYAFESSLAGQKATLIGELQRQLSQPNSSTLERRQAAQNLGLLVGPGQATQALLGCHSMRVRAAQQHLLKQHSAAGGDPDGVEYAGGLAQRTFLAIGAAAEDLRAVFPSPTAGGPGTCPEPDRPPTTAAAAAPVADRGAQVAAVLPPVSALVVQWASDESRACASLLCRHALAPFAATGMAVGALLCCGLALVFCVALERSHGLALRVPFMEELWPLVEVIVRRHMQRLREEASTSASVDATNAALQAVAASSAAGGSNPPLPGPTGLQGFSTGMLAPHPGEGLTELLRRSDTPSSAAAPAGLSCLPMLLPELKAMAEGLASLASRPAVAVLRQGVQAVFESVAEKVVESLTRLVGSSAAATGAGNEVGSSRSLLAAYIIRAETRLRLFAESDVQAALEPLSYVCGPVAPPELLVPCLAPLRELLLKLPEPAPDAAPPPGFDPPQPAVLQPQRSGLLDQIRAELEAGEGQRRRERDGGRPKDAFGRAPEAVAALAVEPAAGMAPAAAAGTALPAASDSPSTSNGLRAQSVGASAPAREANRQSVDPDQGGAAVVEGGRPSQQAPGSVPLAKQLGPPDGDDAVDAGGQAGEAPVRRRRRAAPRVELEDDPEPPAPTVAASERSTVRQPVSGIPIDGAQQPIEEDAAAGVSSPGRRHRRTAAPSPPSHQATDEGEDEAVPTGPSLRSRERGRGQLGGRGTKARSSEPGDSPDAAERAGPWGAQRRRQVQPLRADVRRERPEEDPSSGDDWQGQQPSGQGRRRRKEQREAEAEEELAGSGRAGAQAPRGRQGQERVVRFQHLPRPDAGAGSAGASGTDEEEAPARRAPKAEPHRAATAAAALRQTQLPGLSLAASLHDDGQAGDHDERPSPVLPARRQRWQNEERRGQQQQLEVQAASAPLQRDAAGASAPAALGRAAAARRDRGTGEREGKGGDDAPDPRASPGRRRRNARPDPDAIASSDEGLSQARRARQSRLGQAQCDDDVADRTSTAAVARTGRAPRVSAAAAPPGWAQDELPAGGGGVTPAVGGVERKGNRFGVVLSDDEGEPVPPPRLRGPRPSAAAAAAAAAPSAAGSRGPEFPRPQNAVGSSSLGPMAGDGAAAQAEEGRRWARQERPPGLLPEERGRATAEAKLTLAGQRNVRAAATSDDGSIPDEQQQQQERSTSGRDPAPARSEAGMMGSRPPSGGWSASASAAREAVRSEATGGGAAGGGKDLPGRPQTARERLAARMAAKVAAGEGLL